MYPGARTRPARILGSGGGERAGVETEEMLEDVLVANPDMLGRLTSVGVFAGPGAGRGAVAGAPRRGAGGPAVGLLVVRRIRRRTARRTRAPARVLNRRRGGGHARCPIKSDKRDNTIVFKRSARPVRSTWDATALSVTTMSQYGRLELNASMSWMSLALHRWFGSR